MFVKEESSMRLFVIAAIGFLAAPVAGAKTYYVDCVSGSDNVSGMTEALAWKSIEKASATTFAPGDSLLLKRGTHCSGTLWPKGSGEDGNPIRIDAYGSGPLPIIEAGKSEAAIKLVDQQRWEIQNLETNGGSTYGIYIGASTATGELHHLHLKNLVVHDVEGEVKKKSSGLVILSGLQQATFEDVLIDGVTAYGTTQWAGIYVDQARNVTIRNSIVHDVYGDGIVLFDTVNGTIEKSAAWLTGLQPLETIGTPNAIWTWTCTKCVVQSSEGFWTDSPGIDGGVYDIDWANHDNIVQYNYGHDAQGYCVAVFGAAKLTTTNSIVRYNVCVNNGRSPKLAKRQGDLFLSTWDGGSIDGVLAYNNTFFWNPPVDAPAISIVGVAFQGMQPNRFFNNVVYSTVSRLIDSGSGIQFERNLYWYSGNSAPSWAYGGHRYGGFNSYAAIAPTEMFRDPKLDWLLRMKPHSPPIGDGVRTADNGAQDAFGAKVPTDKAPEIGAIQFSGIPAPSGTVPISLPRNRSKWMLLLFAGNADRDARSQLVFVQTAMAQYGDTSLQAGVVSEAGDDLHFDWNFGSVRPVKIDGLEQLKATGNVPVLLLISPAGEVLRRWQGFVSPAELGLTLKHYLGPARGDPGLSLPLMR